MRVSRRRGAASREWRVLGTIVGLVACLVILDGAGGGGLAVLTNEQESVLRAVSVPAAEATEPPTHPRTPTAHAANTETAAVGSAAPTPNAQKLGATPGIDWPGPSTGAPPGTTAAGRARKVVWSRARSDRSGSAIQDMLMCHAYAFHHGADYGGACIRNWTLPQFVGKRVYHEELLEAVGLSEALRFDCPENRSTKLQNRDDYIERDTGIFTKKYLKHLRGLVAYPARDPGDDGTEPPRRIAVHIRRGDISPCRPRTRGYPRYLPNQHFLRLIQRYDPHNRSDVTVYSESESFEPFDEFRNRGYQVHLDGSIGDVWRGLLASDILVLSRSSFSLVPAVLSKGKVVYTPFWHDPLPHWDVVEESFVNETLTEFRRLKAGCPDPKEARAEKKKQKKAHKNKKKPRA